jgi:hypothetical protein
MKVNEGKKNKKNIGEKMVLRCFQGNAGRHWVYFTPSVSRSRSPPVASPVDILARFRQSRLLMSEAKTNSPSPASCWTRPRRLAMSFGLMQFRSLAIPLILALATVFCGCKEGPVSRPTQPADQPASRPTDAAQLVEGPSTASETGRLR